MGFASRNFNRKQALERGVVDVYAKFTFGTPTAPTATFETTTPIEITHAEVGTIYNGGTVELQVAAAADNPTDTVLADVTGTADAIVITITPNDGTNNAATPVPLTTAELAELLDSGTVVGKTVTVTDTGSLLANIDSATGGDTDDLEEDGEGDGLIATWAGAVDDLSDNSTLGIASVARNDVGDYSIVLQDAYKDVRNFKAILLSSSAADIKVQLHSEAVDDSDSKEVRFVFLSGTTPTDPADGVVVFVKFELKNSSVV